LNFFNRIDVRLSPLPQRLPTDEAVKRGRGHGGIVALHALGQGAAALPPLESRLRRGSTLGILPYQDVHGELVGPGSVLEIAIKGEQPLCFPLVAKAQAASMGEMLAHRRPQMTAKAGQRPQGIERFTRVRLQEGADNRGYPVPIGGAKRRPWGLGQYPLTH
jgi:hypothetical protein